MSHIGRYALRALACVLITLGTTASAFAQHWSGDARRIGMGGVGTSENLASKMAEEERGYRTIVIPFGLFQVLRDTDIFNPDSDDFDLVRSVEYAISPLHFTFDRDGTGTGALLVNALRDGEVSRNLNVYRGFSPVTESVVYGLGNPSFGGTIPVFRSGATRQGVYIGAGPYIGFRGGLTMDERLVSLLASSTDVFLLNTSLPITTDLRAELALAVTGGYRGRFGLPMGASASDRDGIYAAVNYHYLRGFRYEDGDLAVRLDTDNAGLLTVNTSLPAPVLVIRRSSEKGTGFAVDAGVAAVVRRWEIGFGVNGIANEIKWTDVEATTYSLGDVFSGGDFIESAAVPVADVTSKQPVEYTGDLAYRANRWTAVAQVSERVTDNPDDVGRFDGTTYRTGFEYRFVILEPRVGAYYTRERWHPTVGLGVNLGGFGIDVAAFLGDANVQRKKHPAVALSLRIGRRTGR
jgi:hypothetical protein